MHSPKLEAIDKSIAGTARISPIRSTTRISTSLRAMPGALHLAALSVQTAEYLSGLPQGWTNPTPGAVTRAVVDGQFPRSQAGVKSWQSNYMVVCSWLWLLDAACKQQ